MSDEIPAETGDVLITFQNSTSWQSWHSSAHACTSSWLTNAERDAPVASVKVIVSASCLRGKRPSASSKLLRYLESQPNEVYFPYPGFSKHVFNQTQEWRPTMLHTIPTWAVKKQNNTKKENPRVQNETTHQAKKDYASWKLCFSSFCASHVFSCRLNFCVDSTHLGIQTLPWWVWCLNQWGSRLSPPDPSGHNVPAKQGKMHARHVMYRYPQYGCTTDLQIKLFPFFPKQFTVGVLNAFLVWFGHVWSGFFFGNWYKPWIQALRTKKST